MNWMISKTPAEPLLVHCSAGIGRTGTLVALHELYKEFLKAKEKKREFRFSVYTTVLALRHMRQFMVQTDGQYAFIHRFIHMYFK